ncbi:MAG: NADPH-dependent F420 reductase [Gammaproteobacteria bacterium]
MNANGGTRPGVAVLGGTGDLGFGLAGQLARAGYSVTIGSRSAKKAELAAIDVADANPAADVAGAANPDAAAAADIVVMTVPFSSHAATIDSVRDAVQGKIFVDATVPLVPPKVMRVQMPAGGPAAKQAQERLGEDVRVVSAFQNIAAAHLRADDLTRNECDVLVCGNDSEARQAVIELAEAIGLSAWHAGCIDNSAVAEALTSVLIFLNRKYGLEGAGIRITGGEASDCASAAA